MNRLFFLLLIQTDSYNGSCFDVVFYGNGAMSRISAGEKAEETVQVSYNPDDLLSEESLDLESFYDNVCLEECKVRLFAGQDGLDFEIL